MINHHLEEILNSHDSNLIHKYRKMAESKSIFIKKINVPKSITNFEMMKKKLNQSKISTILILHSIMNVLNLRNAYS
jgi:hypothetical protein